MAGLLIDTCNDVFFEGIVDEDEIEDARLDAPSGGDQTANVVITGDSSDVVFETFIVGPGAGTCFDQLVEAMVRNVYWLFPMNKCVFIHSPCENMYIVQLPKMGFIYEDDAINKQHLNAGCYPCYGASRQVAR